MMETIKLLDLVECDAKWFLDKKEHYGKVIGISPNGERLKISSIDYPRLFWLSKKYCRVIK